VTDAVPTAADRRWLAATWPFVRQHLPVPPCRVLDLGCGPLGGHVPALRAAGYRAEGIDPGAPMGPHYHQMEFGSYAPDQPADAIIASTSLHHVSDLNAVVDLIAYRLDPDGILIVVEWARELFDEATARWCFDRLADDEPGWLHHRRDEWLASGQPWDAYLTAWAQTDGLHTGHDILHVLDARFHTRLLTHGPYFFADLDGVTAADEQAHIDAGHIHANGVRYVGTLASRID
jgi:SAM-dependent methyltransferase